MEAPIVPLLGALRDDRLGSLVFPTMLDTFGRDGAAATLRADLLTAGVKRGALHSTTKTRKRIGFYDLRATAWRVRRSAATRRSRS